MAFLPPFTRGGVSPRSELSATDRCSEPIPSPARRSASRSASPSYRGWQVRCDRRRLRQSDSCWRGLGARSTLGVGVEGGSARKQPDGSLAGLRREQAERRREDDPRGEGKKFASHCTVVGHKSGPFPAACSWCQSVDIAITYASVAPPARDGAGSNSRMAPATCTGCMASVSARVH